MTLEQFLWSLLFVSLGAFIGAFLAFWRESKARPNIVIEPGSLVDADFFHNNSRARMIHLRVKNIPWPKWWQRLWFGNRPALYSKAKLDFINSQLKIVIFSIQARWTSAPEPIVPSQENPNAGLFDPSKAVSAEIENILIGDRLKELSVALKAEGSNEFWGFNNWSYAFPNYKNSQWVIQRGSVILKINLWWDSGKLEKCFVINNEQNNIASFCIEDYPNEKCK